MIIGYRNSFYEFEPSYKGYDFIIPNKDIKTIKKWIFSKKIDEKEIIIRISNEIGNLLLCFSRFFLRKKMNRTLFIDDETAFLSRKNISKYGLNNFQINAEVNKKNTNSKICQDM